jgi:hypothetical protein
MHWSNRVDRVDQVDQVDRVDRVDQVGACPLPAASKAVR